jgi:hypothetical protein
VGREFQCIRTMDEVTGNSLPITSSRYMSLLLWINSILQIIHRFIDPLFSIARGNMNSILLARILSLITNRS